MIYDKLSNAKRYLGFSPNLDAALRFIAEHDLNELPLGKTTILDDRVYALVMMITADSSQEPCFKMHEKYLDIHIDIFGKERIDIGDSSHVTVLKSNPKNDVSIVACNTLTECMMESGNFLVCMSEEPHKAGIIISKRHTSKKCIIKVHI